MKKLIITSALFLGMVAPNAVLAQTETQQPKPETSGQSGGQGQKQGGMEGQMKKGAEGGMTKGSQDGNAGASAGAETTEKRTQQDATRSTRDSGGSTAGEQRQSTEGKADNRQQQPGTEGKAASEQQKGANDKAATKQQQNESGSTTGSAQRQTETQGSGAAQSQKQPSSDSAQQKSGVSGETTGSVNVTTQQQTEIRQVITEEKVKPVMEVNFDVTVGTAVPNTIEVHRLPPRIVELVPAYEDYMYFVLADGRIVIVDPNTLEIVYVLSA